MSDEEKEKVGKKHLDKISALIGTDEATLTGAVDHAALNIGATMTQAVIVELARCGVDFSRCPVSTARGRAASHGISAICGKVAETLLRSVPKYEGAAKLNKEKAIDFMMKYFDELAALDEEEAGSGSN